MGENQYYCRLENFQTKSPRALLKLVLKARVADPVELGVLRGSNPIFCLKVESGSVFFLAVGSEITPTGSATPCLDFYPNNEIIILTLISKRKSLLDRNKVGSVSGFFS